MTTISYAQNYEDVLLLRALRDVQRGFYIDVGAQNPVDDSVTKAFYEKGWHGINIEPVLHWHGLVAKDRPHDINLQVAVSDTDKELLLYEVLDTGLSTADKRYADMHAADGRTIEQHVVECLTLDEIIERHAKDVKDIHFLKVDAEGAEAAVMRSISLGRHRPWIMVIEATEPNSQTPAYAEWEPLVLGNGYELVYEDGLNRFYLANEHSELREAFRWPPNHFDFFVRLSEWRLAQEVGRLGNELEAVRGYVEASVQDRVAVGVLQQRLLETRAKHRLLSRKLHLQTQDLHRQNQELYQQTQELHHQNQELHHQNQELHHQVQELHLARAETKRLAEGLQSRERELEGVRAEYGHFRTQILGSSSWRMTRPLRVMRRLMTRPRTEGRRVARGAITKIKWLLASVWRKTRPLLARIVRPIWHKMVRHAWGRRIGIAIFYPLPALRRRLNASIVAHARQGIAGVDEPLQSKTLSAGAQRLYNQLQQGLKRRTSSGGV